MKHSTMTQYQGLEVYSVKLSQFSLEKHFIVKDVMDAARKALKDEDVRDTFQNDAHRKPRMNDISSITYLFTTD